MGSKKVLNLLDLNTKIVKSNHFSGHGILEKAMKQDLIKTVLELYNKKVDADLVEDLFEGWSSEVGMEANCGGNIVIFSNDEYGDYFVVNGEFEQKHRTVKLNSFIYACDEMDIELFWREEAYEKYFNFEI
jgi:hypothetical protein